MIKILFLLLSVHIFAEDIHRLEFPEIPDHVFTIDVVDREEGIVFLKASKKSETGLEIISKVPLELVNVKYCFSPRNDTYSIDERIYQISENKYAIGVNLYHSGSGSRVSLEMKQLQLFHLGSEGIQKIFATDLFNECCRWCSNAIKPSCGSWSDSEVHEADFYVSRWVTNGFFNLDVYATKITTEVNSSWEGEPDKYYEKKSFTHRKLNIYKWNGVKYVSDHPSSGRAGEIESSEAP